MSLRLLCDENISWRLKKSLPKWEILPSNEINPGIRLTDRVIWEYAKSNNFTILTFDEDFSELQNMYSFPPKIIWLRIGNSTTLEIASILVRLENKISAFLHDNELGIFEIYA